MVSINPTNNYQEPNLSINKSHNFIIWQWNEEISMSNCYHVCLLVALFFPSLPYTQGFRRQNNKDKAPWFNLIFTSPLSQGEKLLTVLLHISHLNFSHSLILWVFSWSGHRYAGSRHSVLCIGKLFSTQFSINDSFPLPVPSISQQFLSTKHLLLPICFLHQNHALSLDWKSLGQGLSLG